MRELLVTENEKGEINFDADLTKNDLSEIPVLADIFAFNMLTRLWGGNELMVLAVIRNLALADLAVSTNREEMLNFLDQASKNTAEQVFAFFEKMKADGVEMKLFNPGIKPSERKADESTIVPHLFG